MYVDSFLLVVLFAFLIIDVVLTAYLMRTSARWEQAYWNIYRLLKVERQARDIRN